MLDIKKLREDFEAVKQKIESRGQEDYGLDRVMDLDEKRRKLLAGVEAKKNRQNQDSKQIPKLKKEGKDVSELLAQMKELSEEIKQMDAQVGLIEEELEKALLNIPNTPSDQVPLGASDEDNEEVRRWGEPRSVDFELKAHWDVGTDLDILDFERASKIAGTRFTVYMGV